MDEVKIRVATLDDVEVICNLLKQLRGENCDLEVFNLAYQKKLQSSAGDIIVAEFEEEVVGVADISLHQYLVPLSMLLTIENIVVDEKMRGKGVGKHLINYIVEYAKEHGCFYITLTSGLARESAHKFYENYGFVKTGYRFDYVFLNRQI